ncbi:MAG: hypothetical protein ACK5NK_07355 [Niabella sp.]
MQRIKALIEKLNTQYEFNAGLEEMLATIQLLQKEITGGLKETAVLGSSKVSVLVPNAPSVNLLKDVEPFKDDEKVYFELSVTDEINEDELNELLSIKNQNIPSIAEAMAQQRTGVVSNDIYQGEIDFDKDAVSSVSEIPTLAQYAAIEKEKQPAEKDEPAQKPTLKKMITEEDSGVFLNQLFRGDEDMYERSIKTIDNFNAFAEAEFWIRRELKTKLGWLPENDMVAYFDKLVKKRFS